MPPVCAMSSVPPSVAGPVRLTLDLARLRGDPADFRYSPTLLGALFVASVVLDLVTGQALGQGDDALAHSLMGGSLVLGLCWIALRIRGLAHRYVQTATALVACSLLVSLVQLPLALLVARIAPYCPPGSVPVPSPPDTWKALLSLGLLATLAWQTLVYAHIMRHAMQATYAFALTLVITWVIASIAIEQILFGSA
jgi:hypothetical protein